MNFSNRKKGVLLAVAGGSFWGGSGVAGQVLLQDCGFELASVAIPNRYKAQMEIYATRNA